ncbi:hypothetical protein [Candidatus Villigracilis saccharophilus]|uniref:hypothetical protein n=1 Tax=Candidatus Villigracilis saccharophilus TaxID=3140684 RepID=UPI003135FFEC|nr:hypothetical protein [Anaerolineales bacterium]
MKQRFIIAMILTIVLSTSLVVPVHAEGMARNMGIGEAVNGGLSYNFINMGNHPIHPCIMDRSFGITHFGSPYGMVGCLNRSAPRFKIKHRW